jgi:sugar phosphate isomerase/epimerase
MLGRDGVLPEVVLRGLIAAGYDGIEPNCYQAQHLPRIAELCQRVGIAIHAIPTGRWLDVDEADRDYGRYTAKALEQLSEGAAIAVALNAPLILGLIRGRSSIPAADAEHFFSTVIPELLRRTPGLRMLVEPLAPAEAAWPHTIAEGARLLARLDQPQVTLLADSYHIARAGDLAIEPYRSAIGHLHIRDDRKQIPSSSAPEYAPILRLWRDDRLVLSFEPAIDLDATVARAQAGVAWLRQATARS